MHTMLPSTRAPQVICRVRYLMAPVLRPRARVLDGVDLSPVMVEKARARKLYDTLEVGEVVLAIGNSLGANDGHGHDVNPATGKPYAPNVVLRGDYTRALAEFWADGPRSETPPGHWNSVANEISDSPELARRIGGRGSATSP